MNEENSQMPAEVITAMSLASYGLTEEMEQVRLNTGDQYGFMVFTVNCRTGRMARMTSIQHEHTLNLMESFLIQNGRFQPREALVQSEN